MRAQPGGVDKPANYDAMVAAAHAATIAARAAGADAATIKRSARAAAEEARGPVPAQPPRIPPVVVDDVSRRIMGERDED